MTRVRDLPGWNDAHERCREAYLDLLESPRRMAIVEQIGDEPAGDRDRVVVSDLGLEVSRRVAESEAFTLTCLERWRGAWLARGYRVVNGVPRLASLEAGQWPWVRDRVTLSDDEKPPAAYHERLLPTGGRS